MEKNRIIYYYQTLTDLSSVLIENTYYSWSHFDKVPIK